MNEWEDRLIDASLHELHGRRPPDLSSRVLSALQHAPVDPSPVAVIGGRAPGRNWRRAFLCLVAAALVGFVLAPGVQYLLGSRDPRAGEQVVARLEIPVLSGALECVEVAGGHESVSRYTSGASAPFVARPGNRLRSGASCSALLGPFGSIGSVSSMELEVQSMEFTWKSGAVAASSLTLAVVAGVVTWHGLTNTQTAAAGQTLTLHADAGRDEAAALAAENDRLRRRIEQLESENTQLKHVPTRDPVEPAVVEAPPAPPPAPEADPMVFNDEAYGKALAAVDWKTMGAVTKEMAPLLAQLVEAMANGEELPTELAIKIQELNSKLVAQVPALLKAGLPGIGPNGAYTHPLVVANVLANTLTAAGLPLSGAQQAKVEGLVRAFSAENQSIAAATHEFEIERLLAEVEMKDRFYSEVASQLAPDQHDAMYPKGATGYDGANLFGTGLMTRPYSEGLAASDPAEFARLASSRLGEDLGLDEATTAKVRAVVERGTAAAPELWRDPADATERNLRMWKAGRTTAALRRQIEMMREIQRQVPMTPEQAKKFRALRGVLVPLPKGR